MANLCNELSSTNNHVDHRSIAIVGSGPAGLFLAYLLLRQNIKVTLFEKRREFPIDKVCGEGIMPAGVDILKQYGILDEIIKTKVPHFFFEGITYKNGIIPSLKCNGQFLHGDLGLGIRRVHLSQLLYKLIKDDPNITFHLGVEATPHSSSTEDETYNIKIKNRENPATLEKVIGPFTHLIGADGRLSKIRSLFFGEDKEWASGSRVGASIHYDIKPWSKNVEVWWSEELEAYVTPLSSESISIIFMWDNKKSPRTPCTLQELLSHFPALQILLNYPISHPRGQLQFLSNLPHKAITAATKNIFLIGDAALFYDGITGEGITLALTEVEILYKLLINETSLSLSTFTPLNNNFSIAKEYQKIISPIFSHYIFSTKLALLLSQRSFLQWIAIHLFKLFPFIFVKLIYWSMGRSSHLK